jgi:hypothetical protein
MTASVAGAPLHMVRLQGAGLLYDSMELGHMRVPVVNGELAIRHYLSQAVIAWNRIQRYTTGPDRAR